MIAEDYYSTSETTASTSGAATARQNRNLSSVVSTIRDDGPSTVEDIRSLHDNSPEAEVLEDVVELTEPHRQSLRALPGMAVMLKVVMALMLAAFIGASALLATGRYPAIDDSGLYLANIPVSVVDELIVTKAGMQEMLTQWLAQAKSLLSANSAQESSINMSGETGLAAVQGQQQQIMSRLDELSAALNTLQSRYELDQNDRLVDSIIDRTEQDLQLQTVKKQLAGLRDQVANDKAAAPVVSPMPENGKTEKSLPAQGNWVVNVASSSQEGSIKQLQAQLREKGVTTVMKRIAIKGEPRYRLRVIGFSTSGEAKRYAQKLVQDHGLQGAWASMR